MDWFTILLIFIFFVLPLIQQVVEARKGKRMPPPDQGAEEWDPELLEEWQDPAPARTASSRDTGTSAQKEVDWSEGWGAWPAPEVEEQSREVPVPERPREPVRVPPPPPPEPVEARPRRVEEAASPKPVQEERPRRETPSRVPQVWERRESVASERGRERRASRDRAREAQRVERGSKRRVRQEAVSLAGATLSSRLADSQEVRRAIILSEVLGPPVSLRPPTEGGGAATVR
jgi:hypothetical protein